MTTLSEIVRIERRFARSARLDADLKGTPPLVGYVLQASTRKSLEALATSQRDTCQGAFTWTGPYGGGKSSAALLVGNLVGGGKANRPIAQDLAGPALTKAFAKAFPECGRPWAVVPVTGSRMSLREAITAAATLCFGWSASVSASANRSDAALIEALSGAVTGRSGVLLLLDELGKFLEHAGNSDGDIHLLQDLAERSSRSDGRFVVIGILHQAFDQYVGRLSRESRQEWAKVQGRFQDISFLAGADETVALLGRAIIADKRPAHAATQAKAVAASVAERRPTDARALALALAAAWPLNPVSALLLGSLSRQRFAQNERSVFGFLSSSEPNGFVEYLKTENSSGAVPYNPDRLWDYLVSNFGMALMSGAEGSRFSLAFEAIDRAGAKGGVLHVALTKAAALIEAFRNGSGLAITDAFLAACLPQEKPEAIIAAVDDLVDWAVLIRQPRLGGYAMFAGSDFDLDAAIERARMPPSLDSLLDLPHEVGLGFAVAKRHYFRTGALRAFEIVLQFVSAEDKSTEIAKRLASRKLRSSGVLVLLLSDSSLKRSELERRAQALARVLDAEGIVSAVAAAEDSYRLRDEAIDLLALSRITKEHHQLQGDRIARRELSARRSTCLDAIQSELTEALLRGRWWLGPEPNTAITDSLAIVATALADSAYPQTPLLRSELVQRDRPSSNAMAAVRDLAHAMVNHYSEENLGISGFPAEMGLYLTILKPLGLHRLLEKSSYDFTKYDDSDAGQAIKPAWDILNQSQDVTLDDVFKTWSKRPFGMKRGVMPILALANILSRRDRLAVYVDGLFQSEIDTFFVDKLLQNPTVIRLKAVDRSTKQVGFLASLGSKLGLSDQTAPLPIAQALFQRCRALTPFAQRTADLPENAQAIRDTILRADDPEDLLFRELSELGTDPATRIVGALEAAEQAYPRLLASLRSALAQALGVDELTFAGIAERAKSVITLTNDLRFDAFAMRAAAFEEGQGEIEGLASLLAHKPPRNWSDRDRQQAFLDLARFGRRFREAEALAVVRDRRSSTEALALVVGLDPAMPALLTSFELTETEKVQATSLAESILKELDAAPAQDSVRLAALARAVATLAAHTSLEAL